MRSVSIIVTGLKFRADPEVLHQLDKIQPVSGSEKICPFSGAPCFRPAHTAVRDSQRRVLIFKQAGKVNARGFQDFNKTGNRPLAGQGGTRCPGHQDILVIGQQGA